MIAPSKDKISTSYLFHFVWNTFSSFNTPTIFLRNEVIPLGKGIPDLHIHFAFFLFFIVLILWVML